MSTWTLDFYQLNAQGIADIYWQELLRAPDEGGWVNWFWHLREDGRSLDWVREQIRASEEWHAIHDKPPFVPLPRLVPTGTYFRRDDGTRFTAIECSDFNIFSRFIAGEDIRPILQERADVGFNMLRVWGAYDSTNPAFLAEIGRLDPREHGDYYTKLKEFFDLANTYGLYVEFTVHTAAAIPGHWEQSGAVAQQVTNVILELTNENNAHTPNLDPRQFNPIPGVVCSRGSNGSQSVPVREPSWMNYETFHTNDAFEWWRKGGHNGMELSVGTEGIVPSHVAILVNENTRPDRDGNQNHHEDAAAAAALLVAGSCHHTPSGKKSALFSPQDLAFAVAFVRGAKSVNLNVQDGAYIRRDDLLGTENLRVYERRMPDGLSHIVKIRK